MSIQKPRETSRPTHNVVSGGGGFIGSHLVERLLANGDRVTVLDDFSSGSRWNLPAHDRLSFWQADVTREWPAMEPVDRVYHLASAGGASSHRWVPREMLRTSLVGTERALAFARDHMARLVFTSTAEVSGDPRIPLAGSAQLIDLHKFGPGTSRVEGKRIAEVLIAREIAEHGVDARIARLTSVYGPRMNVHGRGPMHDALRQCVSDERVSGVAEAIFVSDAVDALVRLMENRDAKLVSWIGTRHAAADLADALDACGLGGMEKSGEWPIGQRTERILQVSCFRVPGHRPRVSLTLGVRRTVDWWRESIRSERVLARA